MDIFVKDVELIIKKDRSLHTRQTKYFISPDAQKATCMDIVYLP
jgi:hypothetical protein